VADRYIQDRFLPDKAIDLIDEAGARLRIKRMTAPPDLREIDERIAVVRGEKEAAIDGQDFERAARLRDDEKKLLAERSEKEEKWKTAIRGLPPRWARRRSPRCSPAPPASRLQADRGGVRAAC
jgi:ATP-dependent Clp protease ATP-binding subunit ClpC